jgi:hypothetical protein
VQGSYGGHRCASSGVLPQRGRFMQSVRGAQPKAGADRAAQVARAAKCNQPTGAAHPFNRPRSGGQRYTAPAPLPSLTSTQLARHPTV